MGAIAVYTRTRLDELEAVVERGKTMFLEVGHALLEIREGEMFREAGFGTFGEYLEVRWPELSRRSLYNAIAAATVDDVDGLSPSHLVELARLSPAEQKHLAALAAARQLSVRELRQLIKEQQAFSRPRRPVVLEDLGGPRVLPSADVCTLVVGDALSLPFEDGDGHLDKRHGAPCEGPECPHPALVLESPPYNAGVTYEDDPTGDALPWRDYWNELVVPHFREVFRVLPHGGRFACNLANVLRGGELNKRQHAGAGGEPWAQMVDRLLWSTWSRMGFLPRERFTWVKTTGAEDVVDELDDELTESPNSQSTPFDPRNTITQSTAWGTFGSPSNPVARAVAEPIFVAAKGTHTRKVPRNANSYSIDRDLFMALTRNAWFIPNTVDRSRHPCPWPRGVPDNLLTLYTWPGDLVVNPFMGSGTTAESALELGRRVWGCDRSEIYVHDAQRRAAETLERVASWSRFEVAP